MPVPFVRSLTRWTLLASVATLLAASSGAQAAAQGRREFTVTARKYSFKVEGAAQPEIRVPLGTLVRVTFDAEDIPHSFTTAEATPHYRIDRRAQPGHPVTFDFRADQAGKVEIHCTLALEERCGEMKAYLIVEAK